MNRINKIRIRNAIVVSILYAEAWRQGFLNTATLHSSGRVQGIFLGLSAVFLFLIIGLPIAEYQKTRSVKKALLYQKNFLFIVLSLELVVKNKFKRFIYISGVSIIVLTAAYNLLSSMVPSVYEKNFILISNAITLVSVLVIAFTASVDLKQGKKIFKVTDMPYTDEKKKRKP